MDHRDIRHPPYDPVSRSIFCSLVAYVQLRLSRCQIHPPCRDLKLFSLFEQDVGNTS